MPKDTAMPNVTDASWLPDMYKLVRDQLWGGRWIAPLVTYVVLMAILVWAGGVVWEGVVVPVRRAVGSETFQLGPIWPIVLAAALAVGLALVVNYLIRRIAKLGHDLTESWTLHRNVIVTSGERFQRLEARIKRLEHPHEASPALKELVQQILREQGR